MPHFYRVYQWRIHSIYQMCQCPHGLMPHFYHYGDSNLAKQIESCQCPHGLMPHFYVDQSLKTHNVCFGVNALTGLCLISTYKKQSFPVREKWVSMPSRAYASFLQYPFKNLGFMRFPEPVFAGICQNILTVTVFRAC